MIRKTLALIVLLSTLVLGLTLVAAQSDTQPEPGSPEDNACNPGGVLYREENQDGCPSEWYWRAGWFLARFLTGDISRADFPKEFESVLPPLPQMTVTTVCVPVSIYWPGAWCASSDMTGTIDFGPGTGTPFYYIVFTTNPATCAPTYNGVPLDDDYSTAIYPYALEPAFAPLGLPGYFCAYLTLNP